MGGDRKRARPSRAMGPVTSTEESRNLMNIAVLTSVHAGGG